jgi:hypothetical protein
MESFLWAVNLCAVVYLCFWAIKADDNEIAQKRAKQDKINDDNKQ